MSHPAGVAASPAAADNIDVHAYVGVTDGGWYRFLAARPELTEVNFWRPGGGLAFRALKPGELFFFKTHHPHTYLLPGLSLQKLISGVRAAASRSGR